MNEEKNELFITKNMFIDCIKNLYKKWKSDENNIVEFPSRCTPYSLISNTQFYGPWLCEENEPKYILKPNLDLRFPHLFIIKLGTIVFFFFYPCTQIIFACI